jgi:hypothetical protein
LDDRTGELNEENKNQIFSNYRKSNKDNKSSNINRIIKQGSASPNSLIPLTTTHKIEKISSGFNYSNSNLSSNFSKRDVSKEKIKEAVSLRPNNFIPETTKSPIKIFSPTNKTLILSTKNKYSNLGTKIESFFTKKDPTQQRKSNSPRKNNFEESKNIIIDIRSVDRVKPIFKYKNSKPNTLQLYTKAASPNNETPKSLQEASKVINSTKNRSNDIFKQPDTNSQNTLKDKIIKFCRHNLFEILEVIDFLIKRLKRKDSSKSQIITTNSK